MLESYSVKTNVLDIRVNRNDVVNMICGITNLSEETFNTLGLNGYDHLFRVGATLAFATITREVKWDRTELEQCDIRDLFFLYNYIQELESDGKKISM